MVSKEYLKSKKFLLLLFRILVSLIVIAGIITAITLYFIDKSKSSDIDLSSIQTVIREDE